MIHRLNVLIATLWLALAPAYAQVGQIPGWPPKQHFSSGGGYTGPGDAVSGALAYFGMRAYNAAYAAPGTNPAFQACDTATGLTCVTINILSTGYADRATAIASSACAVQCGLASWTDQTGNGHTVTQGARALYPILLFSGCPATFQMCVQFVAATANYTMASGNLTQAQPFTWSYVAERNGAFTASGSVACFGSGAATAGFFSTANTVFITAGSANKSAAATDSVLHAVQNVFNGATSAITVDGTTTAETSPGTGGAAGTPLRIGDDGNGNHPTHLLYEVGVWPSALSTPNQNLINTNQHGASGWNF